MTKRYPNQKGFSVVEGVLILVVVILIGVVGWLVYKNHHKTTSLAPMTSTSKSAASTNPYAGWKTFSSAGLGVYLRYPSSWELTQLGPQCTGSIQVTLDPSSAELSEAATSIGADLKMYEILINRFGTESSSCAPDGDTFKGYSYNYLQSSSQIQSGDFKNDWLTFYGGTSGNKSQTLPDSAVVTSNDYKSSAGTFANNATLLASGYTYQIEINTSSVTGQQYIITVPMNVAKLKTTRLYSDTMGILNSISTVL